MRSEAINLWMRTLQGQMRTHCSDRKRSDFVKEHMHVQCFLGMYGYLVEIGISHEVLTSKSERDRIRQNYLTDWLAYRADLTGSTNAPDAASIMGRTLANHFLMLACDVAAHLATFSFERPNPAILEAWVDVKRSWMAEVDRLMNAEVLCWYQDRPKLKRA